MICRHWRGYLTARKRLANSTGRGRVFEQAIRYDARALRIQRLRQAGTAQLIVGRCFLGSRFGEMPEHWYLSSNSLAAL